MTLLSFPWFECHFVGSIYYRVATYDKTDLRDQRVLKNRSQSYKRNLVSKRQSIDRITSINIRLKKSLLDKISFIGLPPGRPRRLGTPGDDGKGLSRLVKPATNLTCFYESEVILKLSVYEKKTGRPTTGQLT